MTKKEMILEMAKYSKKNKELPDGFCETEEFKTAMKKPKGKIETIYDDFTNCPEARGWISLYLLWIK